MFCKLLLGIFFILCLTLNFCLLELWYFVNSCVGIFLFLLFCSIFAFWQFYTSGSLFIFRLILPFYFWNFADTLINKSKIITISMPPRTKSYNKCGNLFLIKKHSGKLCFCYSNWFYSKPGWDSVIESFSGRSCG